jgi:hypothetical protein
MSGPASPKGKPTYTSDALWQLRNYELSVIPGAQDGGTYGDFKSCYHNSMQNNLNDYPGAYCVRLPLDLTGPPDLGRAIDTTMSDAEMRKRTGFLKAAAEHPEDNRLDCLREFIGTLDSVNVFCMTHDTDSGGAWSYDWGRDSSHLWHTHKSIFTKYCATWDADLTHPGLEAVASVVGGETWESWKARKGGNAVRFIQVADPCTINGVTIGGGALYLAGVGIAWVHDPELVDDIAGFWRIPNPFADPASVGKFGNIYQAQAVCGPFLGKMDEVFYAGMDDGGGGWTGGVPAHEHSGGTSGPVASAGKL